MPQSARHLTALTLFVAIVFGCGADNVTPVVSPSGDYAAFASIRSAAVYVHLTSPSGGILDEVESGASDYQKWAVGWMHKRDTLVLYSADIGTLAYDVVDGKLLRVDILSGDPKIVQRGKDLFASKYD